jgi:hypothetical protein
MISNQNIMDMWSNLSEDQRQVVIKEFLVIGQQPSEFLRIPRIKNYIYLNFIKQDGKKVVTK